jgi:hypothetical protein
MQWPPTNPTAQHFQKGIPKNRARFMRKALFSKKEGVYAEYAQYAE